MFDSKYDLDSFARDVAMEIQLGGDRFDPSDVGSFLDGIPSDDLVLFKERVLLHSRDFAPCTQSFIDFARNSVGVWLSQVRTAEQKGLRPSGSWFDREALRDDKWKYFKFDDGSFRFCNKTDRRWAFPHGEAGHIVAEMTAPEVLLRLKEELLEDGNLREFREPLVLPEGVVVSLGVNVVDDNGVCYSDIPVAFMSDGSSLPVAVLEEKYPDILIAHLGEEREYLVNDRRRRASLITAVGGDVKESLSADNASVINDGIRFSEPVTVSVPSVDGESQRPMEVRSLFRLPLDTGGSDAFSCFVSGEVTGADGVRREEQIPLHVLSDRDIDRLRRATDALAKKMTQSVSAGLEKKDVSEAVRKTRSAGPSL